MHAPVLTVHLPTPQAPSSLTDSSRGALGSAPSLSRQEMTCRREVGRAGGVGVGAAGAQSSGDSDFSYLGVLAPLYVW